MMMGMTSLSPLNMQRLFVCGLIAFCIFMLWPFIATILLGGVLAVLTYPILRQFRRLRLRQWSAAGLTTALTTVVLFLPLSLLTFVGARTASEQMPYLVQAISPQFFQDLLHRPELLKAQLFLKRSFGLDPDQLRTYALEITQGIGRRVAQVFTAFVGQIPLATLHIIVLILSLLYCLHIGRHFQQFLYRHSVFDLEKTKHLEAKFIAICNSLVLAALVIGIVQAAGFGLVCLALGIENVSVICLVVFMMSLIPIIGSAPFTFGFALYYLVTGESNLGIVLLVTAAIVSIVDNLIRPIILRQGASMNPIIAVFAILGGLRVFGFAGIFLGPLLVGISIESYRMLYVPLDTVRR